MKKRDKFIIGGIVLVALSKLPNLKDQRFDLAGLFGLIIMGSIVGYIGYLIFGREKKGKRAEIGVIKNSPMEGQEKLRLKKKYEEIREEELLNMLSEDPKEYQEGIYELLLEEAKKRGVEEKIIEVKRSKNESDFKITNYASTGKRFLNLFLDYFIMMGLSLALFTILALLGLYPDSLRSFIENNGKAAEYLIGIPLCFLYYFIFESIYQKTPAKFITKTKVLNINGTKPTKRQILKRSLSRFVPFEPLSGFGKKEWYGWHDRWSDTMVVRSDYPEVIQESFVKGEEGGTKSESAIIEKERRKTKRCPYCGEKILYEAIKCQYCKEFLDKK